MSTHLDDLLRDGWVAQQAGKLQQAERAYQDALALNPDDANALRMRAVLALESAEPATAADLATRALSAQPQSAILHFILATARQRLGEPDLAFESFHQAFDFSNSSNELRAIARGLFSLGRPTQATIAYRKAIELSPNEHEIYLELGDVFRECAKTDLTMGCYEQAVSMAPDSVTARESLGWMLISLHRGAEAEVHMRAAVRLRPNDGNRHNVLGAALMEQNKIAEAAAACDRAAALAPGDQATQGFIRWNLARMLLMMGDFERGWREFEWRLWHPDLKLRRDFIEPQWAGEDLADKTILLHAEGGHGDAIHFIRYAPLVAERGATVLVECQPALSGLFQRVPGVSAVYPRGAELPRFDYQISLQSLPHVFQTRLSSVPAHVPYLSAEAENVAVWRKRLDCENHLKVGLAWCGSNVKGDTRTRTLSAFAPLADVPGVRFFGLQKGPAAAEPPPPGMNFVSLEAEIEDFADVAAIIANLDLVITVDTSVAHLAGALGKPTWVLIQFQPDFRWMLGRDDSPWYPTMRLFRQTAAGQWADVFTKVRFALVNVVNRGATAPPQVTAVQNTQNWLLKGVAHQRAGEFHDAEGCYRRAVDANPDDGSALEFLGILLQQMNRPGEGLEFLRRATLVSADKARALHNYGIALDAVGQVGTAVDAWRRAIAERPDMVEARKSLGVALMRTGQYQLALDTFAPAISIRPDDADGYNNMGVALGHLGRLADGAEALRRAVALHPQFPEALHNLGRVQREMGDLAASLESVRQAIAVRPNYSDAIENLGVTLRELGDLQSAMICFQRAIELNPHQHSAYTNLAELHLLTGDLEPGWALHAAHWRQSYEQEYPVAAARRRRWSSQPTWDGSDPAGLSILVFAEQGLGDTVQMARYVPLLAECGAKVIVACQRELTLLMRSLGGVTSFVQLDDAVPPHQVQCSMMDLPRLFRTSLATIPGNVPYLAPDPQRLELWKSKLGGREDALRVGVVWAGNPKFGHDYKRSVPVEHFKALLAVEGIRWYSLQKGTSSEQGLALGEHALIDLGSHFNDMADTAAAIQLLDLVISVDTSVAHVAGALAKPVWTLLPFLPDHRWLLDRDDTPWYLTMRLFRQPRPFGWPELIASVCAALRERVAARVI
jgi:tetratricopeptide (TPR) repeat protein